VSQFAYNSSFILYISPRTVEDSRHFSLATFSLCSLYVEFFVILKDSKSTNEAWIRCKNTLNDLWKINSLKSSAKRRSLCFISHRLNLKSNVVMTMCYMMRCEMWDARINFIWVNKFIYIFFIAFSSSYLRL
jgi:hypothetical protein